MHLSRRDLLRTLPAAALAGTVGLRLPLATAAADDFPGMIVRQEQPRNLETPLTALKGDVVPNEHFFVRNHFAEPVSVEPHSVTIEGHVGKELKLTLDDLKKMEAVSKSIVLECAGNGRVFLVPQVRGAQWSHGAAGNALWTGVPLGAVLERAGVKRGAVDVVLVGADSGAITTDPPSPGAIHFDRGIPLAKAKAHETLLVWEMNKEPLPRSHGGPLRALVGGWYGMASVKWLMRIFVTDKPHAGFWQTMDYSRWDRTGASPQLVPLTAIEPKAVITSPAPASFVKAGAEFTVTGVAWAGENAVAKVELSTDGGKTWAAAEVKGKQPLAWSHWTWRWAVPRANGPASLVARCTDEKGRTQPDKRDPDRRTYMINHLVPVEVTVK